MTRTVTRPDFTAWPTDGFIGRAQMRAALGGCSDAALSNYVADGLLSAPIPWAPGRVGWRVAQARADLDALPQRVAARAEARRRKARDSIVDARAARRGQRAAAVA